RTPSDLVEQHIHILRLSAELSHQEFQQYSQAAEAFRNMDPSTVQELHLNQLKELLDQANRAHLRTTWVHEQMVSEAERIGFKIQREKF
ncbi:hypothetical protein OC845_006335, partial [Tilletia horrida]